MLEKSSFDSAEVRQKTLLLIANARSRRTRGQRGRGGRRAARRGGVDGRALCHCAADVFTASSDDEQISKNISLFNQFNFVSQLQLPFCLDSISSTCGEVDALAKYPLDNH